MIINNCIFKFVVFNFSHVTLCSNDAIKLSSLKGQLSIAQLVERRTVEVNRLLRAAILRSLVQIRLERVNFSSVPTLQL